MLCPPTTGGSVKGSPPPEDMDRARPARRPDIVGERDIGLGDLPTPSGAIELLEDLGDLGSAGRADRMPLRFQATRWVDRQGPVAGGHALDRRRPSPAGR